MPVYPQVLQYMRTNCSIEQTEVVAVVLEDLASATTSSYTSIKANIEAQGMGWTKKIMKDFSCLVQVPPEYAEESMRKRGNVVALN